MSTQSFRDRVSGPFAGDTDRAQRNKVIAVSVILAIALIWLAATLIPRFRGQPALLVLDTPGWRLVNKINAELATKPPFVDVMSNLESETPLKLKMFGAVRSDDDLQEFQRFMEQLRSENTGAEFDTSGVTVLRE